MPHKSPTAVRSPTNGRAGALDCASLFHGPGATALPHRDCVDALAALHRCQSSLHSSQHTHNQDVCIESSTTGWESQ